MKSKMPFPMIKLATLMFKSFSKPVANYLKKNAKSNETFKGMCKGVAQMYHWGDVNIRMNMLGLGRAKKVEPLKPDMAVELGAEILGEMVIYTVAVLGIYLEYSRGSKNAEIKEQERKYEFLKLERRVNDMLIVTEEQDVKIKELQRNFYDLESKSRGVWSKWFEKKTLEENQKEEEKKKG